MSEFIFIDDISTHGMFVVAFTQQSHDLIKNFVGDYCLRPLDTIPIIIIRRSSAQTIFI